MSASIFDPETAIGQRRVVIRRNADDVEMVELAWGFRPAEREGRPFTLIRAEGRRFPTHRCLVPASEFRFRSQGRHYSVSLVDDDWFYFAGLWRPEQEGWPAAYAILTIEANTDIRPLHDRQMAVLRREARMRWLDHAGGEQELLKPLPAGTFKMGRWEHQTRDGLLL